MGILYLPYGIFRAGIICGFIITLFSALLAYLGYTRLILWGKIYSGNYSVIGYHILGKFGKLLIDFLLTLSQMFFSSAYYVYILLSLFHLK